MKSLGIIGMVQETLKLLSIETLVFEWPKDCFACGLFARRTRLFELHFLYNMLQGDRLNPCSSLVNQLPSPATSSA